MIAFAIGSGSENVEGFVSNITRNKGTITDIKGYFEISVRLNDTLVFSAVQYKRKENTVRMIMCTTLDTVRVGEPVLISYHSGMRCYQHSRHVVTSNEDNCIGGFYYTDGTPA